MFKIEQAQIDELRRFAFISDKEIRSDLCRGYIKDENDYTSNFTGALRRNINSYSKTGLKATSILLGSSQERLVGCDAAIIICSQGQSKVSVFEAKWPRMETNYYRWDYPQTATGLSHFSDQLARQTKYHEFIAIFEIFYCEFMPYEQPKYMQNEVSSCVWHSQAESYKNERSEPDSIWDHDDVKSLLENGSVDIGEIIEKICLCREGSPTPMTDPEMIAGQFQLPENVLFVEASERSNKEN